MITKLNTATGRTRPAMPKPHNCADYATYTMCKVCAAEYRIADLWHELRRIEGGE